MKHLKRYDESIHEREVVFTNKRNPRLEIIVTKLPFLKDMNGDIFSLTNFNI
jgi:hypothetical protein